MSSLSLIKLEPLISISPAERSGLRPSPKTELAGPHDCFSLKQFSSEKSMVGNLAHGFKGTQSRLRCH